MTLGIYLRRVLLEDGALAAAVGERVYARVLPQTRQMPAVVYTLVSGTDDDQVLGESGSGLRGARVQIDAWATTLAEADSVGELVRSALDGHEGAARGLLVQGVFPGLSRWDFEPETKLYRAMRDFEVAWSSS